MLGDLLLCVNGMSLKLLNHFIVGYSITKACFRTEQTVIGFNRSFPVLGIFMQLIRKKEMIKT